MQNLAEKQDLQKQRSVAIGGLDATPVTVNHEHPLIELQRTIGNHAVERLLQTNTEENLASSNLGHTLSRTPLAVQRQPAGQAPKPTLIKQRPGNTDRIEDAYGPGTLDETQWRNLLDSAKEAYEKGNFRSATNAYLTLYADIAKLAQADRVVNTSGGINVVTGSKNTCKDARPGLNLSLLDEGQWEANASTGYVDDQGKFNVHLNPRGTIQPQVAIVLSRSAFRPEKEQTLAALRHEMVHAELDNEDATKALLSNSKDTSPPSMISAANSELLGYIEGFMTMFHLTHPAPDSSSHPAFVELLGVIETRQTLPWEYADPAVRSEALGRLQEYYCHALDQKHRESFDGFVSIQLNRSRANAAPGSFFRSLQSIIESKCEKLTTPMKL